MQGTSNGIQTACYRFAAGGITFEVQPADRLLVRDGDPAPVSPKAFDCLLLLLARAGRLLRKDELMDALWPTQPVTEANLTNCIVSLRKVLGPDAIHTVSRHGYRFALKVDGEPGISPEIYQIFSRAKELIHERSPESMRQARDILLVCVAECPGFAAFWAWLGRCCWMLTKATSFSAEPYDPTDAAFRRAFKLDPELPCAHQFYTAVELDNGRFLQALRRLNQRPAEPETYAALVQVLRFSGLLDRSIRAHASAVDLDPAAVTSVAHTYFLAGDFPAAIESYSGRSGYYMDTAAWAALGETDRCTAVLRERLEGKALSPLMSGLMASLLALLEGSPEECVSIMERTNVEREPEAMVYFARHHARAGNPEGAVTMIRRAADRGFRCAPETLRNHEWMQPLLATSAGQRLLDDTKTWRDEALAADRKG